MCWIAFRKHKKIIAFLFISQNWDVVVVVKILPHGRQGPRYLTQPMISGDTKRSWYLGTILCMRPANERRRYNVTSHWLGALYCIHKVIPGIDLVFAQYSDLSTTRVTFHSSSPWLRWRELCRGQFQDYFLENLGFSLGPGDAYITWLVANYGISNTTVLEIP